MGEKGEEKAKKEPSSIDRWASKFGSCFFLFSLPRIPQELSSFCSPLPGVRLVNTLGTPVDLAPLPIG